MAETYSRKRYVSVCANCDLLFDTVRRDQMTCSPACRVKAHRRGETKRRRAYARENHYPPAYIGFVEATDRLRPDLSLRILAGEAEFEDIMPDLCDAFDEVLRRIVSQSWGAGNE